MKRTDPYFLEGFLAAGASRGKNEMREGVRRGVEFHGISILGRSIIAGLLVAAFVGIGAGSAASTHSSRWGPTSRSKTTQKITFASSPPSPAVAGGAYTPTASGGASGNPVTFSIDWSARGSCSISGATVTFVAVGTCVIDANQAGNANYWAATQVQQSFAVLRHPDHHLHLDPAQPRGRRRHLRGHGGRGGQWQAGHLLDRPLGAWKLQHLGCDRHLRRRRDLRHRRQPGGERQL
jgi:hypothetical protein